MSCLFDFLADMQTWTMFRQIPAVREFGENWLFFLAEEGVFEKREVGAQ